MRKKITRIITWKETWARVEVEVQDASQPCHPKAFNNKTKEYDIEISKKNVVLL